MTHHQSKTRPPIPIYITFLRRSSCTSCETHPRGAEGSALGFWKRPEDGRGMLPKERAEVATLTRHPFGGAKLRLLRRSKKRCSGFTLVFHGHPLLPALFSEGLLLIAFSAYPEVRIRIRHRQLGIKFISNRITDA